MSACPDTVLVIEDSANDALFLQRALEAAGCRCRLHVVRNGKEAFTYLTAGDPGHERAVRPVPRLIFLDLTLPLLAGFEVLAWLNAGAACAVPVIVLTSSGEESDKRRALQLGVKAYIEKPPDKEVIRAIVQRFRLDQAPVLVPECRPEPEIPASRFTSSAAE